MDKCAEYREKTPTKEYRYPEWQLSYYCKHNNQCACAELDRRERFRSGIAKPVKVAKERMRTGKQYYHESLSREYQRIKNLPPKKLGKLAKEYVSERKAHPKLTNDIILQIAKDHLAYKSRPRKRWKRTRNPARGASRLIKLDPKDIEEAKKLAIRLLREKGIDDSFTVKVKSSSAPTARVRGGGNWVALYRSRSQFGPHPIFWINSGLGEVLSSFHDSMTAMTGQDVFDAILQNILHEYGHVIYEWASVRDSGLKNIIDSVWADEEDYAEDFLRYIRDENDADDSDHQRVVTRFIKSALE